MAKEKLIRDKLDAKIPAEELRIETDAAAIERMLRAKLQEELDELRASDYGDAGEYADVIEVLYALAGRHGMTPEQIEARRLTKLAERGGFERGLVWLGPVEDNAASASTIDARQLGMTLPPKNAIHIYADGACSGNPGPGGWGTVVIDDSGKLTEIGGGEKATTNNRMELMAAINGLKETLNRKPVQVTLYLDSTYVCDGLRSWVNGWKRRGWKTAGGAPVKNQDLWMELDRLKSDLEKIGVKLVLQWVKGHNGDPGNERADVIARQQAARHS